MIRVAWRHVSMMHLPVGSSAKRPITILLAVLIVLVAVNMGAQVRVAASPDDCLALGGAMVVGECQISAPQTKSGAFTLDETLHILGTGSITVPALSGGNALTLNIKGDLIIDVGGQVIGDVSTAGGIGATVSINADGDIVLHGVGTSGARISSSQSAGSCTGGRGGNINLDAGGQIVVEPGSVIAANSNRCRAGDIVMTAGGIISIDGLVSSGPNTTVNPLPGRLTGQVLGGGGTTQAGGKITIVCKSLTSPSLTVSKEGILVSQGEDPGADTVMIEGCDVEINGLVASVGKQNRAEVILRSGDHITINGQDLGQTDISSFPNQGRVRADNTQTGASQSKVDIFARGSIDILGPPSGTVFVVTSNPGSANSRPAGGFITVISLEDRITATGKIFQAGKSTAGNSGGTVDLKAKLDVGLDGAIMAVGDFYATGGYGTGGEINVRSFSGAVSWVNGVGDVQPTGTGIAEADRGVITLTACSTIDTTGTSFPVTSGSATTPTISTGVCSPSAPTLPEGVADLPYCSIITIIKDTVPDDAQDFSFTTTGGLSPSSFTLDDDPLDLTLPNNQTYTRVASGSYNVTETLPVAGFELTNLVCTDPDGGTTVDLGTGTATIDVDASENITCTFTNEPSAVLTGSITIIKDTKPDDPQDFSYTTTGTGLSDFSLDDDGDNTNDLSNSMTFTGLVPGEYGVNETLPVAGFSLTGLSCEVTGDGTIATPNQATGEVSITLGAGGTVTCTFTNVNPAGLSGAIRVDKVTDPAGDPNSFDFLLVSGADTPSLSQLFSLNDTQAPYDSGLLTPGNYSVTENVPSGWDLTGLTCSVTGDHGSSWSIDPSSNAKVNINLKAGDVVTCTYTDTKRAECVELKAISIFGEEISGVRVKLDGGCYYTSICLPLEGKHKVTVGKTMRINGVKYTFLGWATDSTPPLDMIYTSTSISFDAQPGAAFYPVYAPAQYKLTVYVKVGGKPITGATVQVDVPSTSQSFTMTTDKHGKVTFSGIYGGETLTLKVIINGDERYSASMTLKGNTTVKVYL
jgi:hypothetical protein